MMDEAEPINSIIASLMTPGLKAAFPDFNGDDILTEIGKERTATMFKLGLSFGAGRSLIFGVDLLKPDWLSNPWILKHQSMTGNGGKAIAGPLLIIHGQGDELLDVIKLTAVIEKTAKLFPEASIKYVQFEGALHNGTISASQWVWMDWIAERFAGVEQKAGFESEVRKTARSVESYQGALNWWLAPATTFYETP
jgi:pimeloyl-ACP methyl ester carboxylesterase